MAEIIELRPHFTKGEQRTACLEKTGTAKILFFQGVRYENLTTGTAEQAAGQDCGERGRARKNSYAADVRSNYRNQTPVRRMWPK